jgi:pimeloyl-ACP methyl ester carboxylesterase
MVSEAGAKVRKAPAGLAFYDPPKLKRMPRGPGKPIWVRKATGLVPLENAASTRLLLYTSTGVGVRKRIAVSGSLSVPKDQPPRRGWPVISYSHGTTGIADICAPTRNREGAPAVEDSSFIDTQASEWLRAGYAVARTDYEGLGTPGVHRYTIGKSEARGAIDIVRAARKLDPRIGRRVVFAGHSQGGQSSLFATDAAGRRASGLRLRGTVAYAPASHILEQRNLLPVLTAPGDPSRYAALIVKSAASVSAEVRPRQLLSAEALHVFPQVDETCIRQLRAPDSFGGIAPSNFFRDGADTRALDRILEEANPQVSSSPAPILIAQGTADSNAPKPFADMLISELVADGNDVEYAVYEGVDHGDIAVQAQGRVKRWLAQNMPSRQNRGGTP